MGTFRACMLCKAPTQPHGWKAQDLAQIVPSHEDESGISSVHPAGSNQQAAVLRKQVPPPSGQPVFLLP